MSDQTPPLRLETLKAYAQEIFAPIRRGESVTTVWSPMLGRRVRNKFIITYPHLFAKEIGEKDYLLVYVEPLELTEESSAGYIKLILSSIEEEYKKKTGNEKKVQAADTYPELLATLAALIQEIARGGGYEIVLFLGEFDELSFANSVLYNNFKSLWAKAEGKLHFVFMVLCDVTSSDSLKKFGELNALLLKNVVCVPLLGQLDSDYLIDYFADGLHHTFTEDEKSLIKELCGGHPYLLKACTRLVALGNQKDLSYTRQMLLSHFEPRSAAQKIFDQLNEEEQIFLRSIVSVPSTLVPESATRLVHLGLIYKNKEEWWVPFCQLFQSVIESGTNKRRILSQAPPERGIYYDKETGAILVNGENCEDKFTRQEYEIVKFLLRELGKLRSREEVGEAMWGKESYDKYSDWAIDQVMSKIRKKFKMLGAEKALTTIRGRGYKLSGEGN